jgi:hypothetical protein
MSAIKSLFRRFDVASKRHQTSVNQTPASCQQTNSNLACTVSNARQQKQTLACATKNPLRTNGSFDSESALATLTSH